MFYLIPSNPLFVPTELAQRAALTFFQKVSPLPNANGRYLCQAYDRVRFFSAGEAFDAVVCTSCKARLKVGYEAEHQEWWSGIVSQMQSPLEQIVITMPCCGQKKYLLDMRFDMPGAFASFALGALEPSDSDFWEDEDRPFGFLRESTMSEFEKILGNSVTQLWEYR